MARPENRSDARSLNLTLPTETFNYLVLLATLGKIGRTENEVATHILVREAYAMYERGFHNERVARARRAIRVAGRGSQAARRQRDERELRQQRRGRAHGSAAARGQPEPL